MSAAPQTLLHYPPATLTDCMLPRRYKNLVPDTPLHRHLEQLLRENGGTLPVATICTEVLGLDPSGNGLSVALVEALIEEDARFHLNGGGTLEWVEPPAGEVWERCRRLAVVDVETTNGPREEQRVIEIGLCLVEDGRIVAEWDSLVNAERRIPYWVRKITGITDADVRTAPRFEELIPRLLDDIEDAILVAHHARFDVACLNTELRRAVGKRLANRYLCTVELSRRLLPGSDNYRLETLSQWLRLTHTRPHRAGSDARATAELLCHLLAQEGVAWGDFLRPHPVAPAAEKVAETKPPAAS